MATALQGQTELELELRQAERQEEMDNGTRRFFRCVVCEDHGCEHCPAVRLER